jgi:hypothetical protein
LRRAIALDLGGFSRCDNRRDETRERIVLSKDAAEAPID